MQRSDLLLIGTVAALAALGWTFAGGGVDLTFADSRLSGAIDEEIAKLTVKPRSTESIAEKAARVRTAINQGDYAAAQRVTADVLTESRLQNWRFYPFNDFINAITNVNDPALEPRLDAWVAQNETDAIPFLIRAQYYHDMGWFRRGHRLIRDIQPADLAAFASYMTKALADAETAIRLNDTNPYAFHLRLRILRGYGMTQKMKSAFDEAIAKYPGYYPLYDLVLTTLDPRWGGTIEAMYAFVDRYAGHSAEQSPLRLLYLSFYRDLLNAASFACGSYARDKEKLPQCVAAFMQEHVRPSLDDQVEAALRLYDHSDRYEFGVAVEPILSEVLRTGGGDGYAGVILQSAANAMHSNTQLTEDKPGHNDYTIDDAVATSWYAKRFYDNALKKYLEALKDIETMTFPSEREKDAAIAHIYEYIAGVHDQLGQYAEMIAYEKASIALGGRRDYEHLVCFGYYKLKDYVSAKAACTQAIDAKADNMFARYWRARALRDSGDMDAAVQDYIIVAESQHDYRTSAAIDLSVVYGNRKDFKSALDVLNKYTYLYSLDTNNSTDIAVSYNNRCYNYMQLGELKKALADCTASLKYASLPDAIRKEQELIKRLNAGEKSL